MLKKPVYRTSRKPIFAIIGVSALLAIFIALWRNYSFPVPQPLSIMAIQPVPLEYGATTIQGIIQKDSPENDKGSFLLSLPDGRAVFLDVQGIDHLIGLQANIKGNLSLTNSDKPYLIMIVESITISQE